MWEINNIYYYIDARVALNCENDTEAEKGTSPFFRKENKWTEPLLHWTRCSSNSLRPFHGLFLVVDVKQ